MHIEIILTELEFFIGNMVGVASLVFFSIKLYFTYRKNPSEK